MAVEIVPQPSGELREALEQALERELADERRPSAWWLAGVRESAGLDDEL